MAKKYCKYTKEQLQEYCNDESYCVKCVVGPMHISLPPFGLKKFNETVRSIVSSEKLNRFDSKLNGIVLDIQSIKVVGDEFAVRNDSSALHVSLNVKFYVFQPRIGAVLIGIVKHVALHHISVTIHRFFNVMIPIETRNSALKTNMTVMVKLTKFDLDDSIPYFEGKLVEVLRQDQKENSMDSGVGTTDSTNIRVKREQTTNGLSESDRDSDTSDRFVPAVKREIKQNISHGTMAKVKQEPVSSSESSSSSDSDSANSTKKLNPTPKLQIKLKNEKRSSSSSSSDDDSSTGSNKTRHKSQSAATFVQTQHSRKRKRESGTSIIGRSLQKMNETQNKDSDSSSSSDDEIDSKKKLKNISMSDSSFASPGLSSTRIATNTKKTKSKGKNSGTNDFLRKMMSRFDK